MLKCHVRLWLKTNTGTEDVSHGTALLSKSVDDRSTLWHHWGLEHVGQDAEYRVEALVLGRVVGLPGDTGHELGEDDEVDDEWGGKEGVLANIEQRDGLVAAHEDLGVVLVERALVVANGWHVLDDDGVVWVLALLVQDVVGLDHIVDDVGLGDLLGAELLVGRQVLAVIVAEMVVGSDGGQLDTGGDEEVNEGGLHLGLAGLEVVTSDEGALLLGELNGTCNECVLWGAVDEWNLVKDTCDSEDGGWSNLLVSGLDGLHEVLGGVVDTWDELSEALGVGSPEDNDLVKTVGGLEIAHVLADLLNVLHAGLITRDQVISTILLVGGDEVWVVDGWKWLDGSHLFSNHLLEGWLKDGSAIHGILQVHGGDIPSTDDEVIWVDHWEDLVEWDVDVLGGLRISAQLHGGSHSDGSVVVGGAWTLTSLPGEVVTVGDDAGGDGGAVVASKTDQHHSDLWDGALDLEVVDGLLWSGNILAVSVLLNMSSTVGI